MRTRIKRVSLLLLVFIASCRLSFLNPPSTPPEAAVDPTPFLGRWLLVEMVGRPAKKGVEATVFKDAHGKLFVTYREGEDSSTEDVILTRIDNTLVAGFRGESKEWDILSATLGNSGKTLTLKSVDLRQIRKDVESGVLRGRIIDFDSDEQLIEVSASQEELRTYLENHKTLFSDPGLVFKKPQ